MESMLQRSWRICLLVGLVGLGGCNNNAAAPGTPMVTAVRARPWNTPHSTGTELRTEHYTIYTTTNNRVLREYLPGFMEAAHANYLALTGLSDRKLPRPMVIYMMADRREWLDLSRSVFGRRSEMFNSLAAGGYSYKGVGVFWDIGNLATFAVAAHEGLHQFFHHRLADRLPLWLEEGLCVTAEGYEISGDSVTFTHRRNTIRFNDLRTAIIQGRWIPLPKLLTMDSTEALAGGTEEAVGYYGQLWALIMFIRSDQGYRAGLERLLADAEAGRLHQAIGVSAARLAYNKQVAEAIFRHYISDDLAGFGEDYAAFAKRLVKL